MRRWVFFAIAVPVGAWLLDRLADQIALRRGEGALTGVLRAPNARRVARRTR